MNDEEGLRREIVRIGRLMYEKGFICSSEGNISARLENDRLLITPSGLHKGFLETEQLLVVDLEGRMVRSKSENDQTLKPTSELPMHLEVYRQRPRVGAVVHAHPPQAIAASIAGVSLEEHALPEVVVLLGRIPVTDYGTPSTEENAFVIRDLIRRHDALVLRRHGSLTVGRDPLEAFMRLETVEQNARIAITLAQLGTHNPLPRSEVEKLLQMRERMGLDRPSDEAILTAAEDHA